jgi:hypothetical protein
MKVLIRNTALDGRPLDGDGEVFTGRSPLELVLRNAKMLAGIELVVKGDALQEKAASFLAALVDQGLAVILDEKTAGVGVPTVVWQGIDAVRLWGLTNMLDRPAVVRIAGELGFPEAARWITTHPRDYAEGVFRGFEAEDGGGR